MHSWIVSSQSCCFDLEMLARLLVLVNEVACGLWLSTYWCMRLTCIIYT